VWLKKRQRSTRPCVSSRMLSSILSYYRLMERCIGKQWNSSISSRNKHSTNALSMIHLISLNCFDSPSLLLFIEETQMPLSHITLSFSPPLLYHPPIATRRLGLHITRFAFFPGLRIQFETSLLSREMKSASSRRHR
jgi:hypothetical protein